uniref:Uncharacterized protein n=1 Tax=Arion vulgaris TaxID=1028688 RepID=A0A0B7AWZ9_9EUPU
MAEIPSSPSTPVTAFVSSNCGKNCCRFRIGDYSYNRRCDSSAQDTLRVSRDKKIVAEEEEIQSGLKTRLNNDSLTLLNQIRQHIT